MDHIITWRSKKSSGGKIPEAIYLKIRGFILHELTIAGETTLSELLNKIPSALCLLQKEHLYWYLLQVKLDLQVQNIIKVSFGPGCVQTIKLRPDARHKIKAQLVR